MEHQIFNEISSFWENLMVPIVLGISTILFILWIMGKDNRNYWRDKIIEEKSNKYVLANGIYIPKKITKNELLKAKLKQLIGFSELKPIFLVFLLVLLLYGVHKIILIIFEPSLGMVIPNILFACGADDYLLADLWRYIPEAENLSQVYYYIKDKATYHQDMEVLISIEAYLKLFFFITIIVLLTEIKKFKLKNINRLLGVMSLIIILLACTYFVQIQSYKKDTLYKCHEVLYELSNETHIENEEDINVYKNKLQAEKIYWEDSLYFGAYCLNSIDFIKDAVEEFYRLYLQKVSG